MTPFLENSYDSGTERSIATVDLLHAKTALSAFITQANVQRPLRDHLHPRLLIEEYAWSDDRRG